jgi:hypothetical protein
MSYLYSESSRQNVGWVTGHLEGFRGFCQYLQVNDYIHDYTVPSIHSSMNLQPLLGPALFFIFVIFFLHRRYDSLDE